MQIPQKQRGESQTHAPPWASRWCAFRDSEPTKTQKSPTREPTTPSCHPLSVKRTNSLRRRFPERSMQWSPVKGIPTHNRTEQAATRVYTFAQRRRRIISGRHCQTHKPQQAREMSRREVKSVTIVKPREAPPHNRRGGQHTHNSAQTQRIRARQAGEDAPQQSAQYRKDAQRVTVPFFNRSERQRAKAQTGDAEASFFSRISTHQHAQRCDSRLKAPHRANSHRNRATGRRVWAPNAWRRTHRPRPRRPPTLLPSLMLHPCARQTTTTPNQTLYHRTQSAPPTHLRLRRAKTTKTTGTDNVQTTGP